ncbi:hypothetical protein BVC80_9083g132 [Macleaya cordata]|uniref:Kelch repeat type 1 n=1 Tax=Macleaya cordata TaxID=56857 RepID=A0A200PRH2_MACCD|nr:hypothetical protein BVC80_9083g132 [Macleaya cordata]
MRWERIQLNTSNSVEGPGKRWGQTCNTLEGGKFLYLFGGYGGDNSQTNEIHVFNTTIEMWSKPEVNGVPPCPRDSHSCTTVGNSLFVFGGTDGKNPLKDLHIFRTSTSTWISPSLGGEGPAAREGHSAALVGKSLFIFGGSGRSPDNLREVYYNDLYILDTETLMWRRAVTSGVPPSARDSHTCSSWKNKIIVVAGEDASDRYLSDVHILDTDTLVWRELSTSGDILPPRAGHLTVALGKYLFVFGGFANDRVLYGDLHMLNIESGVWTKVVAAGQGPSARFSVAGDCVDFQNGVIAFIGGCNQHLQALDDIYYLHTDSENGQDKLSLRKELKRRCQEQSLNSIENDKNVPELGTSNDFCQPMPLQCVSQADKPLSGLKPSSEKIFEAKVTDALSFGYTIETIIDGKPLRGVLFSFKPGFIDAANTNLNSSNGYSNSGTGEGVDGARLPDVKTPTPVQQVVVDKGQADNVQRKESRSQKAAIEVTHASNLKLDVSQAQTVPEKSETSATPLSDLKEDEANGSTNPGTEVPPEDPSMTAKDMYQRWTVPPVTEEQYPDQMNSLWKELSNTSETSDGLQSPYYSIQVSKINLENVYTGLNLEKTHHRCFGGISLYWRANLNRGRSPMSCMYENFYIDN